MLKETEKLLDRFYDFDENLADELVHHLDENYVERSGESGQTAYIVTIDSGEATAQTVLDDLELLKIMLNDWLAENVAVLIEPRPMTERRVRYVGE